MTQLEYAKNNTITPLMKRIARIEGIPAAAILKSLKEGRLVIPCNSRHKIKKPCGIGQGLKTKINANIGTSPDRCRLNEEIKKLGIAEKFGADAIMDLSVGADIETTRKQIIKRSNVPVGTVPVYEIAVGAQANRGDFLKFTANDMLRVLESQAQDGVDFFTIHAGVTRKNVALLKKNKRVLGIVSRGGAIIAAWMQRNNKENPFFEYFDSILDIAYKYDITLSLGDGLRPGSILDATDKAQLAELKSLGALAKRARQRNVQVMIEGPGHVPLNQIRKNITLAKRYCGQAPFYVLGPLVTDIGAGYDHITAAIGGALAAGYGADFLCYVTPAEHLRHPSAEDVREGVVASKIAAHAADLSKGLKSAWKKDRLISEARKKRDWQAQIRLSVDPEKAKKYRLSSKPHLLDVCTMCGKYCSIKLMERCMG